MQITVHPLRLSAQIMACKVHVNSGGAMKLTRNAPTVKALREEYGLPNSVRTFAQALDCLVQIQAIIDEQIVEAKRVAAGLDPDPYRWDEDAQDWVDA